MFNIKQRSFVFLTFKYENLSFTDGCNAEVNATKNRYTLKIDSLPLHIDSIDNAPGIKAPNAYIIPPKMQADIIISGLVIIGP